MKVKAIWWGLLSCVMAGVLLLFCAAPGRAAELTDGERPETTAETALSQTQPQETEPVQTQPGETAASTEPAQTIPEETETAADTSSGVMRMQRKTWKWNWYYGQLHAHTNVSGAEGTVEEAFTYASQVEGLDFFAVTDYSHSYEKEMSGDITKDGTELTSEWAAGKAAAASVTNESFVGIYGYEMAWKDSWYVGHISTYNTPGWQSRNQEDFDSSSNYYKYYDALTQVPESISQFNHPNEDFNFDGFKNCSEEYDAVIHLLEVGSGSKIETMYYDMALKQGWHVAPTNNQNNFSGQWGDASGARTVILAEELTEKSLYEAIRARRVYATEDPDLWICYDLNGAVMGSITGVKEESLITVTVQDPTDEGACTVEVYADTGTKVTQAEKPIKTETMDAGTDTLQIPLKGEANYYYLKITQADGDAAVTAPVWLAEDVEVPEETTKPTDPPEETTQPSEPEETTQPTEPLYPPPEDMQGNLYFGQLHAHTAFSDGRGSVEAAFAGAAKAENMDFFAVTDHSNSLDNDTLGAIGQAGSQISEEWASGKAAAQAATTDAFVALFGYEMTWQEEKSLGHITTFNTPGWQSRNQDGFSSLKSYYEALVTVPQSVSQFNHPGSEYGEFRKFSDWSAAYDQAVSLLEVGGEGNFSAYGYYTQALDAGWHVAPTTGENLHNGQWETPGTVRTVILAQTLTEQSLYEAMANRRVYATEDVDLQLYYRLDGAVMGDIIGTGDSHEIQLWFRDPTDEMVGTVEVIGNGGAVLARETPGIAGGDLTLTVPGGQKYYFLKITQPDGDIAVTAPVWTDDYEDMGINKFSADSQLPVQGTALNLSMEFYNNEAVPLLLESLECYAGDTLVWSRQEAVTVETGKTYTCSFSYTHPDLGVTHFRLVVRGNVDGKPRSYEQTMTLRYRSAQMVSGILVDGSHSSLTEEQLDNLTSLAKDVQMDVTIFTEDMPQGGEILIIPAPEEAFSEYYVDLVTEFAANGGSVILCGKAEDEVAAAQLNRLLQAIGSTMTIRGDVAVDEHHNGGSEEKLFSSVYREDSFWCASVTKEQVYSHTGCTVDPGEGTWLVRGGSTSRSRQTGEKSPVLLAWEESAWGGSLFAAGSLFMSDEAMPLPKNRWDAPYINQTIMETLMGIERTILPRSSISQVRKGENGEVFRVVGYATSGTSNIFTTFPDTIYLQDDTAGIAVGSFSDRGIQIGMPLEVIGYRDRQQGNLVLELIDYRVLDEDWYRYVPSTLNHSRAMDYDALGGSLLQVEAQVTSVTYTEDGEGVSRFTLRDAWGDEATVMIQDYIRSGAYGTNTLATQVKIGRTVRAMGLLHLDENGIPVLRVRNCEEVVYVPPFPKPGENPYTGDRILAVAGTGAASLVMLRVLSGRKKRRSR